MVKRRKFPFKTKIDTHLILYERLPFKLDALFFVRSLRVIKLLKFLEQTHKLF